MPYVSVENLSASHKNLYANETKTRPYIDMPARYLMQVAKPKPQSAHETSPPFISIHGHQTYREQSVPLTFISNA